MALRERVLGNTELPETPNEVGTFASERERELLGNFAPALYLADGRKITSKDYKLFTYQDPENFSITHYELCDTEGKLPTICFSIERGEGVTTFQVTVENNTPENLIIDRITILETTSLAGADMHEDLALGGPQFNSWSNHTAPLPLANNQHVKPFPLRNPWEKQLEKYERVFSPGVIAINRKSQEMMLLAAVSSHRSHTMLRISPEGQNMRIEVASLRENTTLHPGDSISSEKVVLINNSSYAQLHETYGKLIAREMGSKHPQKPTLTSSSWYSQSHPPNPDEITKDMERLALFLKDNASSVNLSYQLDDGCLNYPGEPIGPNTPFANGRLEKVISKAKEVGITPVLWSALFSAAQDSWIHKNHPEWLVKDKDGDSQVMKKGVWKRNGNEGLVYGLDLSNDKVWTEYLIPLLSWFKDIGIDHIKLDFSYCGATVNHGRLQDKTSVEVYREALQKVRNILGDNSHILICGAPLLASAGLVDTMRVTDDTGYCYDSLRSDGTPGGLRAAVSSIPQMIFYRHVSEIDCDVIPFKRDCGLTGSQIMQFHMMMAVATGRQVTFGIGDPISTLQPLAKEMILKLTNDMLTIEPGQPFLLPTHEMVIGMRKIMDGCSECVLFNFENAPQAVTYQGKSISIPAHGFQIVPEEN